MSINDQILEQTNKGLSKDAIRKNLITSGHEPQQIDTAFDTIFPNYEVEEAAAAPQEGSTSLLAILGGIFFVFVAIMRFVRFSNSGGSSNVFLLIGVFTAIGMAIYFFTKKD